MSDLWWNIIGVVLVAVIFGSPAALLIWGDRQRAKRPRLEKFHRERGRTYTRRECLDLGITPYNAEGVTIVRVNDRVISEIDGKKYFVEDKETIQLAREMYPHNEVECGVMTIYPPLKGRNTHK